MSLPTLNPRSLQHYPRITVDRASVIKPCVADQVASEQFIQRPVSSWTRVLHDIYYDGIPYILKQICSIQISSNSNSYYTLFIRFLKFLALFLLHIHRIYLYIYGYFYPYSLLSLDEVCDEFSRCPKWTESIIRAFAWHPNFNRCAIAICNDYIYIYEDALKIRALRHNQQRKIVDLAWHPGCKEILIVATQTNIIIWTISGNQQTMIGGNETSKYIKLTPLMPGTNPTLRDRSAKIEPMTKENGSLNGFTENHITPSSSTQVFKIISNILQPPIISIRFQHESNNLYVCSPNSSKIAILDIDKIIHQEETSGKKQNQHIKYLRKFGHGMTKLLWSPDETRMAASTTSSFVRVFECFRLSCRDWQTRGGLIQDLAWSKPSGRMLLLATKGEPCLYTLPFLDHAQANDVGGNNSMMKALDLTEIRSEIGLSVGGCVQSLAWDKSGKRLAISFKDNPESVLIYRTVEKPTFEFHQMGVIQSENGSSALLIDFHDKFKDGSLLTICWSDGQCQHVPLTHSPSEQLRELSQRDFGSNANSPSRTPRSLTNFCHVGGTNSISTYSPYLEPINKIQQQTTLFSLSRRSLTEENNSPDTSTNNQ